MNKISLAITKIGLILVLHIALTGFMWSMMVLNGDGEKMDSTPGFQWFLWGVFLVYSGMASAMPLITMVVNNFEKDRDASKQVTTHDS